MPVLPHDRYATLADLLEARYDDMQDDPVPLRYGDIAASIGYTDSYVGGLHRGRANTAVAKWRAGMAVDFLRAYRFTTQEVREIAQRYDLQNVLEYFELKDANTPARVKEGGQKVRFLGAVSAGRFGAAYAEDGVVYEDIPSHVLRHHDPTDVFAVTVAGDSMMTDDARASVPQGAIVYFHHRLRPSTGDVVCVRLEEHDLSVLKRYQPGERFTTLTSLNSKHRPIVIDEDTRASLQGVMIGFSAATR